MAILDPIFNPLLKLDAVWVIAVISLIISLIVTIIYKFMTDQNLMKRLKDEMKALQNEMKELKAHPEKMMEVQKKAMQTNMQYMMQSMKSTLVTFIPIIIIFGWMNANIAYEPLLPGQEFTASTNFAGETNGLISIDSFPELEIQGNKTRSIDDGRVVWVLKGNAGDYTLEYDYNGEKYTQEVLITNEQAYKPVSKIIKGSELKSLQIGNKPKKVLDLGFWNMGWLGSYIIFSLAFSMLLRKVFKLY